MRFPLLSAEGMLASLLSERGDGISKGCFFRYNENKARKLL